MAVDNPRVDLPDEHPVADLPNENKDGEDILNEMRSLIGTIKSSAQEVSTSLKSTVKKLENKEITVTNGISVLDVKNHNKLMYLANLACLFGARLFDEDISQSQSVQSLVELRTVIERIRPVEHKLKYHIDKCIKIATRGEADPNDPTSFKANPNMMDASDEEENTGKKNKKKETEEKSNIYRPPRLSLVHYDGDETKSERQARSVERARKRALSSNLMQELKEEYLDRPMEYSHSSSNTLKNVTSERERERQDYEETYFTRLPLEKKQKRPSFNQMTLGGIGDQVTRFEDLSVLHGGEVAAKRRKKMGDGKKKSRKGKAKGKKRKFK